MRAETLTRCTTSATRIPTSATSGEMDAKDVPSFATGDYVEIKATPSFSLNLITCSTLKKTNSGYYYMQYLMFIWHILPRR
jgi:hypothetical protein